jgi:hypothetical protein
MSIGGRPGPFGGGERSRSVIRFGLLGLLAAMLLVPVGAASSSERVDAGAGITAVLPPRWRLVHQSITTCADPVQRLLATTAQGKLGPSYRVPDKEAVVLLMETTAGRFPARPARFELPRKLTNLGGCCEIPSGPGAEIAFREGHRKFYAFVYVGARSKAGAEVSTLLNSLRISPRH